MEGLTLMTQDVLKIFMFVRSMHFKNYKMQHKLVSTHNTERRTLLYMDIQHAGKG